MLSGYLRRHGFRTRLCATPKDAVPFLARRTPDVMILDNFWRAYEPRSALCEPQNARHIPTIVTGSCDERSAGLDALDWGADDFLRKPFSLPEITARVRALIRRTAARNETLSR